MPGSGGNDFDNGLVEIVGNQLKVRGGASIDYESSQLLRLNVRVTDNGNLPLSFTKPLTVSVLNVNEPTYSIIAASSSVNEGQPLAFAVAISGVAIGTPFYWAFDGSGIDQSDLSGSGLSGYGTTDANGQFMFTTGLANDYKIEGTEYLNARLFTDPSRLTQLPILVTSPLPIHPGNDPNRQEPLCSSCQVCDFRSSLVSTISSLTSEISAAPGMVGPRLPWRASISTTVGWM